MSGIVGHTIYAVLAAKASEARGLPVTSILRGHFSSYLAGAYLGCDIQTLPAAICVDTGRPVGYGSIPIEASPITGGKVRPWTLSHAGRAYTPREIHGRLYGRTHLVLGWQGENRDFEIPLSRLVEYASSAAGDAMDLFGPGRRSLAYVFGWLTHVMGDGLIKSVIDGVNLDLLGGKYTAQNRPVQDLVCFHEVGIGELGLDWAALLGDLATTPVEAVQAHYMRCGPRQGRLGAHFEEGWAPEDEKLVHAVMAENRRHQERRNAELLKQLALDENGECDPALREKSGGLSYREMLAAADEANYRHALWQMGELIADFFEKVIDAEEALADLPDSEGPDWEELTRKWGKR